MFTVALILWFSSDANFNPTEPVRQGALTVVYFASTQGCEEALARVQASSERIVNGVCVSTAPSEQHGKRRD